MNPAVYICLLIAGLTIFVIRAIPMTIIQKEISNVFIKSFLYYVPYVTLSVMAFPAILTATGNPISGIAAFIVAVIIAYVDGNLFKVALSSCIAVFLTEFILTLL